MWKNYNWEYSNKINNVNFDKICFQGTTIYVTWLTGN